MRKILSFVLVLSLILGSFSMAFAATPPSDIAASPNAEAITVGVNLGIIDGFPDGTYKPTQAVNRAEFAKLMTKALGIPDSALAGYANTTFKDVSGYQWAIPYLAFCQAKGIMIGDGNGNVRPGATISVNEAMTMLMRAVGYTESSAALVGTWPAKYVSLAKNNGMYDDVANAVTLDRANAAQVIYNALSVSKVEVAADGATKTLADKNGVAITMLTSGLNCTATEDYVIVGNEDSYISLKGYVGQKTTVYKDKDGFIVAIASVDSKSMSGKFKADLDLYTSGSSVISVSGASIKFIDNDDVEYAVKANTVSYYFKNGEEEDVTTGAVDVSSDEAVTLNAKIVGKEVREIYGISKWVADNAKKVATSDLNQISEARLLGSDFATNKDKSINTNSFALEGVSSLDKIKADNVVYVYEGPTSNEITKVCVGTETVTGDITKVKGDKVTINGKDYERSTEKNAIVELPEAGDNVVLYLDCHGDIFSVDNKTSANDLFAVVATNAPVKDEFRFYTSVDDEYVWKTVKTTHRSTVADAQTGTILPLLAYSANKDGGIATVSTLGGIATSGSVTLSSVSLLQVSATTYHAVDSKCVVFMSTTGGIITGVTTIGNVETGTPLANTVNVTYMLSKSNNKVVAMIVDEDMASKAAEDTYGVLSDYASVKDEAGDSVHQLIGFANGKAMDKMTDDKVAGIANVSDFPGLFELKFTADGKIKTSSLLSLSGDPKELFTGLNGGETVKTVINDGEAFEMTDGTKIGLSKDVVVYRAHMNSKNKVEKYTLSEKGSIGVGNYVFVYNTDDDEKKSPGAEVVILVTKYN